MLAICTWSSGDCHWRSANQFRAFWQGSTHKQPIFRARAFRAREQHANTVGVNAHKSKSFVGQSCWLCDRVDALLLGLCISGVMFSTPLVELNPICLPPEFLCIFGRTRKYRYQGRHFADVFEDHGDRKLESPRSNYGNRDAFFNKAFIWVFYVNSLLVCSKSRSTFSWFLQVTLCIRKYDDCGTVLCLKQAESRSRRECAGIWSFSLWQLDTFLGLW